MPVKDRDQSCRRRQRGEQPTDVSLVGAALVFGAIYYKTHREQLISRYQTWRERLGGWE